MSRPDWFDLFTMALIAAIAMVGCTDAWETTQQLDAVDSRIDALETQVAAR